VVRGGSSQGSLESRHSFGIPVGTEERLGETRGQGLHAGGEIVSLSTGSSLYVEMRGEGRPLVVVHGGPGIDHTYLRPWLDPLGEDMRLIYVDLPGCGRSGELPVSEYTHERFVRDLEALRDHFGLNRWAMLGHSYGGFILQDYVLEHPDVVTHLALVNSSPAWMRLGFDDGLQAVSDKLTPEISEALAALATVDTDEEWRHNWLTYFPLYFHDYDVPSLVANDRTIYRVKVLRRFLDVEAPGHDVRARLGEIYVPTLVVAGRYDFSTPVRHSNVLYKGIPSSELVVFERSGHFPFIEEQEKFLEAARRFFGVV
jgi:proline iminopeptidase